MEESQIQRTFFSLFQFFALFDVDFSCKISFLIILISKDL
jgi:hypothetical protein